MSVVRSRSCSVFSADVQEERCKVYFPLNKGDVLCDTSCNDEGLALLLAVAREAAVIE